jgi:Kelch motif/Galactose oxidase, central domain
VTSSPWTRRRRLAAITRLALVITLGISTAALGLPAVGGPALATAVTMVRAHGLGPPNTWVAAGQMDAARSGQTATTLRDGKVLVAGGGTASAELYNPATRTFSATGRMPVAVAGATASLLTDGSVLVAGGLQRGHQVASAELYDPATGTWSATGAMKVARSGQTATLLPNGQVLVAGGGCNGGFMACSPDTTLSTLSSAELYNPATGKWRFTGGMRTGRQYQTATLLPAGDVLVTGGLNNCDEGVCTDTSTAELYHPSTGKWTSTGSMHTVRERHTATLLPDGDVLVAGGLNQGGFLGNPGGNSTDAEIYHPATGKWTRAASMARPHIGQTATLLRGGWVLIAGGRTKVAEIYEPQRGIWVTPGAMTTVRTSQTATLLPNGHVLVTGGSGPDGQPLSTAEEFLAGPGPLVTVTPASIAFGGQQVGTTSGTHTYQVTNYGSADLVATGAGLTGRHPGDFRAATDCAKTPVPPGSTCTVQVRFAPTSTGPRTAAAVLSDNAPGAPQGPAVGGFGGGPDAWVPVGSMTTPRDSFTATLLPNGKVLMAGGETSVTHSVATADLYNPATRSFSPTGSLHTAREAATATLLRDGQVLVAGGSGNLGNLSSAELYNPATGKWRFTAPMHTGGSGLTSTLLHNGRVLVVGLDFGKSAEVYDPASRTWTDTGPMKAPQFLGTTVLLGNGKVLAVGGEGTAAELYNPATNDWTSAGSMLVIQRTPAATLLPGGQVLVAGGSTPGAGGHSLATVELYDPATGFWSLTDPMGVGRSGETATLGADQLVLVTGGCTRQCHGRQTLSSTETFAEGRWFSDRPMTRPRVLQTATLLRDGNVLVAGGGSDSPGGRATATAELYTPPLDFVHPTSGPVGTKVTVTGSGFYAHETIQLAWDGRKIIGLARTTAAGTFTGSVTIPKTARGRHLLFADSERSMTGAITPFTVTG